MGDKIKNLIKLYDKRLSTYKEDTCIANKPEAILRDSYVIDCDLITAREHVSKLKENSFLPNSPRSSYLLGVYCSLIQIFYNVSERLNTSSQMFDTLLIRNYSTEIYNIINQYIPLYDKDMWIMALYQQLNDHSGKLFTATGHDRNTFEIYATNNCTLLMKTFLKDTNPFYTVGDIIMAVSFLGNMYNNVLINFNVSSFLKDYYNMDIDQAFKLSTTIKNTDYDLFVKGFHFITEKAKFIDTLTRYFSEVFSIEKSALKTSPVDQLDTKKMMEHKVGAVMDKTFLLTKINKILRYGTDITKFLFYKGLGYILASLVGTDRSFKELKDLADNIDHMMHQDIEMTMSRARLLPFIKEEIETRSAPDIDRFLEVDRFSLLLKSCKSFKEVNTKLYNIHPDLFNSDKSNIYVTGILAGMYYHSIYQTDRLVNKDR